MNRRRHWSYSSLSQYLRCPLQYFFKYILALPEQSTSSSLVLGSAVHAALAVYHRSVQSGTPAKSTQLQKVFLDVWRQRETQQTISYRNTESRDESTAVGIGLLETYLQESPPENIVDVERRLTVPVQNSEGTFLQTPMVVVVDLLTRVGDKLGVREFKTSGRTYSQSEIDTGLQPTCYVHATREFYGEAPPVEYTVLVKTKTPKVQRLTTTRSDNDLGRLGDLVQTVERSIDADVFYPIESPLNCSTCPYRKPCRNWSTAWTSSPEPVELTSAPEEAGCSSN